MVPARANSGRSVCFREMGKPARYASLALDCLRLCSMHICYGNVAALRADEPLKEALEILDRFEHAGLQTNSTMYARLMRGCDMVATLTAAKWFHARVAKAGFELHTFLCNRLVSMYDRCGSVQDARRVFDGLPSKNMVSWKTIIAAYNNHGNGKEVFKLFIEMNSAQVKPDKIAFISLINAFAGRANLQEAKLLHAHIKHSELESDMAVSNALIHMYSKCGSLKAAQTVFWQMPDHDVISWTALIAAYARLADIKKAQQMYHQMQHEGVGPNKITLLTILNACTSPVALAEGKRVHALITNSPIESDVIIGNALVTMYGKCKSIQDSKNVFNNMHERNVVSWNAMITAYAQHGCGKEAIELFRQMESGVKPNTITFVCIVDACVSQTLATGKLVHAHILNSTVKLDVVSETALLNMYSKHGTLEDASRIFCNMSKRNVVSWTALISAYAHHGHGRDAFHLFLQMNKEGITPNKVTFIAILDACSGPATSSEGKLIHAAIIYSGVESDVIIGNALINMYGKCGKAEDACELFSKNSNHDVVSWTTMIAIYSQNGYGRQAFHLFQKMQQGSMKPNYITFVIVLDTCATLSYLAEGKLVHAVFVETGHHLDLVVGTALVNMYGECGSLQEAYKIFSVIPGKDVASWNAMLAGYSQHGYGSQALRLYQCMEAAGVQPNDITFISVITACSHAGLVDLGHDYFDCMKQIHGIAPTVEHFVCMVDLFGRAGRLEEAENFIYKMPFQPTAMVWMSYLAACRLHGNIVGGAFAAENLQKLEPDNSGAYVVLSNIYAAEIRQGDAVKGRKDMVQRGVKKDSSIGVKE